MANGNLKNWADRQLNPDAEAAKPENPGHEGQEEETGSEEAKKEGNPNDLAAQPQLWGALYEPPVPDEAGHSCANCIMFVPSTGQCSIHKPDVEVTGDHTCGYHVTGDPMPAPVEHPGLMPVEPENSGLEEVPGGTTCANCHWFTAAGEDMGVCRALVDEEEQQAEVEAKACCSRWEATGNPEEGPEELTDEIANALVAEDEAGGAAE